MVRTQIQLEEEQYRFLKERSRQTGESLAALIRHAVDRMRDSERPLRERAHRLIGAFEADAPDVADRHDESFADAAKG